MYLVIINFGVQPLVRRNKGLFEPDFLVSVLRKSVPCKSAPHGGSEGLGCTQGQGRIKMVFVSWSS